MALEGKARLGELRTLPRSHQQLLAQRIVQRIEPRRHRGLGDVEPLGRLVEVAGIDHRKEGFESREVHDLNSMLSI